MANRYYTFAEREFYHVYNRGNSKQIIFKNESDYDRFKKLLYIANNKERFVMRDFDEIDVFDLERKEPLVSIGAYCLMQNHFHLLLTPAVENGIQKFMLKLGTAYSSYFNKKYDRTGSFFEGHYKARYAESDRYLKYLFSYIHLNPYKDEAGIKKISEAELDTYPYSSLLEYIGKERKNEVKILDREQFPEYFLTTKDHKRELMEWLDYQEI